MKENYMNAGLKYRVNKFTSMMSPFVTHHWHSISPQSRSINKNYFLDN